MFNKFKTYSIFTKNMHKYDVTTQDTRRVKSMRELYLVILRAEALQATLNDVVSIQILNKIKKTRLNGRLDQ